jgi:hypothetical protein
MLEYTKGFLKNAWPYQQDKMNLPVADVETAVPFYESKMGFILESITKTPIKSAILHRDEIRIGLSENGGDPTQDGCFFEVDSVQKIMEELNHYGWNKQNSEIGFETHGTTSWNVFYLVAPDGLCYCFGERLP